MTSRIQGEGILMMTHVEGKGYLHESGKLEIQEI